MSCKRVGNKWVVRWRVGGQQIRSKPRAPQGHGSPKEVLAWVAYAERWVAENPPSRAVQRKRTFTHGDGKRTTKQVAEDFHDAVRHAAKHGQLASIERPVMTLGQLAEEWSNSVTISPKTLKLYDWLYRAHIAPAFADQIAGQITTRDVEQWQARLETGEVAKQKAMTLLHQLFEAGMRWDFVQSNPVKRAKRPKPPAKKAVRPPSIQEVEAIRARLKLGDATLVSVLAYAGLRPQEALGLRWSDVRDKTLLIDAPKTGRSRSVRILSPLARDLNEWKLALGSSDLVFPSKRGHQITESGWANWRQRIWKPIAPEGMTPYALRHLFVSLLIQEGLSVVEVAAQAGHSPQVCLSTYAHEIAELQGIGGSEDAIWKAREERKAA